MIEFKAKAKKGAIVRTLARAIAEKLERLRGPETRLLTEAALQSKRAATQLIQAAPAGSEVGVRISIEDDPLGNWASCVQVDVKPARAE